MKKTTIALIISAVLVGVGVALALVGIISGARTSISVGPNGVQVGEGTFYDFAPLSKPEVSAPKAPSAPDAPSAPEAPTAPDAPTAPEKPSKEGGTVDSSYSDGGYYGAVKTIDSFRSADIQLITPNVSFIESDRWAIEYRLSDSEKLTVCAVNNGVLEVSSRGQFTINFGFNFFDRDEVYFRVYYPKDSEFSKISVGTTSGNIKTTNVKTETLKLTSTSGNIRMDGCDVVEGSASSTSGNVAADGFSGNNFGASSTSGNISFENAQFESFNGSSTSGRLEIEEFAAARAELGTTSGDFDLNNFSSDQLQMNTTSGHIRGKKLDLGGLSFGSTSGDLELEGVKLHGNADLHSMSGNIELKILGNVNAYTCDLSSMSGDMEINGDERKQTSGGQYTFKANTMSGDIDLWFTDVQ